MNETCRKLSEWGCDIDGTMKRFLNDENLYMLCLNSVLKETSFDSLGAALQKKDCTQAFEAAHNLKGVLANLGLTPLYDIAIKMVEPLRAGNVEGHDENYRQLMEGKEKLTALITG